MAVDELNFDPKDIAEALRKNVESFTPSVEREEVGRVVEAGDGIARVKGLPGAMANELLEFPVGSSGWRSTSTRTRSAASSSASPPRSRRATSSSRPARSCRSRWATGSWAA